MEALGMIETKGLIASVEAADIMTKTAEVKLKGITPVGDGLVTVMVEGELDAVRASVNAGAAAAERIGTVVLTHVIPRPNKAVARALAAILHTDASDDPPVDQRDANASETVEIPGQETASAFLSENQETGAQDEKDTFVKEPVLVCCEKAEEADFSGASPSQDPVSEGTAASTQQDAAALKKTAASRREKKRNASQTSDKDKNNVDLSAYTGMTVGELRAKAREMNVETLSRKDIRFAKKDVLLTAIEAHLKK